LNSAFRIWSSLVALAIIVQVGLAGYGAFNAVDKSDDNGTIGKDAVEHGFNGHVALGYIIFLVTIVLLVLAFLSRRHGAVGRVKWSGILVGLMVLQILLAWAGDATPWLGILHGMNALAVAAFAGTLAGREWASYRGGVPSPA
jgi:hypothetical protein